MEHFLMLYLFFVFYSILILPIGKGIKKYLQFTFTKI